MVANDTLIAESRTGPASTGLLLTGTLDMQRARSDVGTGCACGAHCTTQWEMTNGIHPRLPHNSGTPLYLQRIAQHCTSRLQTSALPHYRLAHICSTMASGNSATQHTPEFDLVCLFDTLTLTDTRTSGGAAGCDKLPGLGATPPISRVRVPRQRANHGGRLGSWVSLHLARANCPVAGEQLL